MDKLVGAEDARCGYLYKRGQRHKAWKERWFVLRGDKLYYYKSHDSPNCINFISLTDAVVRVAPNQKPTYRKGGQQFLFEVNTKQRVFDLRARTHADMETWVEELKKKTGKDVHGDNDLIDLLQDWIEQGEYETANEDEAELITLSSLDGLLHHREGLGHFMSYVMANHCEENLLFWVEANDYKTEARTGEARKQRAMEIYNKFIKANANLEVSLDGLDRNKIQVAIEKGDPNFNAFDEVMQKTHQLLLAGSFPAFLKSKAFLSALIEIGEKRRRDAARQLAKEKEMLDKMHHEQKAAVDDEIDLDAPIPSSPNERDHDMSPEPGQPPSLLNAAPAGGAGAIN